MNEVRTEFMEEIHQSLFFSVPSVSSVRNGFARRTVQVLSNPILHEHYHISLFLLYFPLRPLCPLCLRF